MLMLSSCMAFAERLSRFYKEAEAFKIFLTQLKLEKNLFGFDGSVECILNDDQNRRHFKFT